MNEACRRVGGGVVYGVSPVGVVTGDKDGVSERSLGSKIFVSAADCIIFVPD